MFWLSKTNTSTRFRKHKTVVYPDGQAGDGILPRNTFILAFSIPITGTRHANIFANPKYTGEALILPVKMGKFGQH
jgi:hypothetical protein